MIYNNHPKWEEQEDVDTLTEEDTPHVIVLHNDEVNTFDFVIDCLIEICDHTPEQAEQCTFLVHYKGKCEVKTGAKEELIPINNALLKRGLSSEIV
ncbi:MAG: ATP-dependent Clp protease adaptor ClpS [Flavobacteriaceae bacterium]|jgi:ATP-dependent Clp protease adaptor protein ClpS|nr:ATP-dependent Clp protease adaptor ClpS [Flavobacteriaceae bacterium]